MMYHIMYNYITAALLHRMMLKIRTLESNEHMQKKKTKKKKKKKKKKMKSVSLQIVDAAVAVIFFMNVITLHHGHTQVISFWRTCRRWYFSNNYYKKRFKSKEQYTHIITVVTWSGGRYHAVIFVERMCTLLVNRLDWVVKAQNKHKITSSEWSNIIRSHETRNLECDPMVSAHPWDVIQSTRSSYYSNAVFIIYLISHLKPVRELLTWRFEYWRH